MNYYYGQQTSPPANTSLAVPSPSNLDISCIVDPIGGKGGIFVGNITAANNNELLTACGIRAMLTAAMEATVTPDSNVTPSYLKIQALDYPNFALNEYFDQGADFIHQNIATTNILVHCMAGISRSVSLVIAYLIKYRKMEFQGALAHLRSRRAIVLSLLRKSNPNEGFVGQLCEYEKRLKKEDKADQKRRRKLEKMLRNHHPALNTPSEQNLQQLAMRKSILASNVAVQKSYAQNNTSNVMPTQKQSALRGSEAYNREMLKQTNSASKLPSQQDLYYSQATKSNISGYNPSKTSIPTQQQSQGNSQGQLANSAIQQQQLGASQQQIASQNQLPPPLPQSQQQLPAPDQSQVQPTQQQQVQPASQTYSQGSSNTSVINNLASQKTLPASQGPQGSQGPQATQPTSQVQQQQQQYAAYAQAQAQQAALLAQQQQNYNTYAQYYNQQLYGAPGQANQQLAAQQAAQVVAQQTTQQATQLTKQLPSTKALQAPQNSLSQPAQQPQANPAQLYGNLNTAQPQQASQANLNTYAPQTQYTAQQQQQLVALQQQQMYAAQQQQYNQMLAQQQMVAYTKSQEDLYAQQQRNIMQQQAQQQQAATARAYGQNMPGYNNYRGGYGYY